MRKLIFGINITIDGSCDHTKGIADEEVHDFFGELMKDAGTLLYGRKTYELMVPFWPDIAKNNSGETRPMIDFAKAFDAVDEIVVFSKTMKKTEHAKARVATKDLTEEIKYLKEQDGKNILLGGVDLPSQIMQLDLIDEYYFVVQPLLGGDSARLLNGINLPENIKLTLLDTKVFKSGCVALHYERRK